MFTRDISIPAFLHFIYGETTCLRDMLLIHGGSFMAGLYVLFGNQGADTWSSWQQVAAVLLTFDLAGGIVAHVLPKNRDYWRSIRPELLILWGVSYAWQPLLFSKTFMGGYYSCRGFIQAVSYSFWVNTGLVTDICLPGYWLPFWAVFWPIRYCKSPRN